MDVRRRPNGGLLAAAVLLTAAAVPAQGVNYTRHNNLALQQYGYLLSSLGVTVPKDSPPAGRLSPPRPEMGATELNTFALSADQSLYMLSSLRCSKDMIVSCWHSCTHVHGSSHAGGQLVCLATATYVRAGVVDLLLVLQPINMGACQHSRAEVRPSRCCWALAFHQSGQCLAGALVLDTAVHTWIAVRMVMLWISAR